MEVVHSNKSPQLPLRTRTTSWLVGEGQAGTELPTTGSEVPAPVTLKGPLSPHKGHRR